MNSVDERIKAFQADFEAVCNKHDIDAAFVLIKGVDELGSLLVCGGVEPLCGYVESALLVTSVEAKGARH